MWSRLQYFTDFSYHKNSSFGFLKNKLLETEKIEKSAFPVIKEQLKNIQDQEKRINQLVNQLDKAEKNVFDSQTKITGLTEEKDLLEERIHELIEKTQSPDKIIFDEEKIDAIKEENKRLKDDVSILTAKLNKSIDGKSSELLEKLKFENSNLKDELGKIKDSNLDKVSKLVEERNVWRSRAVQNQIYSIEESIAEIKNRIAEFEKENRKLIEEKENLLNKIKNKSK